MTSNWKKYKLQDLTLKQNQGVNTTTEKVKYCENGTHKVVRAKNILPYKLLLDDVVYIDDNTFKKINDNCKPQKNDILYTNIGSQLGNASLVTTNEDFIIAWNVLRLQLDQTKILPSYFLCLLNSNENKQKIVSLNSSSTMPFVSGTELSKVEFTIPPLETQQKIAKVLSAIDDKIELNNSINNNLEQQIKALYNHCFTDKNNVVEISNLIDVRDGTHDSPKPQFEGKKLITSKHLLKYGVDISSANFITEEDYQKINERSLVATDDILISMIGTVGIVSYIIENPVDFAVKNVGIYRTSQKKEYAYYVHCFLNSTETQNYILSHLAGTTQKYISLSELRTLKINVPNQNELKAFNKLVEPIYNNLISNTNENIRLVQLRDTLLPKLMSGEIDVDNVEV